MIFHVEQDLDAPADVVFDAVADARNEPRWNSQVTRSDLVSGEPVAEGSRFKTVNRGVEYDAAIVRYDRPRRLEFAVSGPRMDIDARFTFEAVDANRSRLRGEFDMRPKGMLRFLFPLMAPLVRRDLPAQMQRLRAFCGGRR